MDSIPLVSIGLPVYNEEKFLGATIASLLGQTLSDIEIIVSDNASSDRTKAICREVAARHTGTRGHGGRASRRSGGHESDGRI